jgi:hypothetical protein
MKAGEAERHIRSKLIGIYEDQEASNIAAILIIHYRPFKNRKACKKRRVA